MIGVGCGDLKKALLAKGCNVSRNNSHVNQTAVAGEGMLVQTSGTVLE